jgi:hypothetical protein
VGNAEAAALAARAEARLELAHEAHGAKGRKLTSHLQRDVTRETRGQQGASEVRIARSRAALAPRPGAAPTPARGGPEVEVELSRTVSHVEERDTGV